MIDDTRNSESETESSQTSPEDSNTISSPTAKQDIDQSPPNNPTEDTGVPPQVQEEPGTSTELQNPQPPPEAKQSPNAAAKEEASYLKQLRRYHNDMNGLLAGKENMKIVAIDVSARKAFHTKWVTEANQTMRLVVNLRKRIDKLSA